MMTVVRRGGERKRGRRIIVHFFRGGDGARNNTERKKYFRPFDLTVRVVVSSCPFTIQIPVSQTVKKNQYSLSVFLLVFYLCGEPSTSKKHKYLHCACPNCGGVDTEWRSSAVDDNDPCVRGGGGRH